MYITGSYSTTLHAEGSIKAFNYSNSKEKWLQIHPTQEWHDLYSSEGSDDLQRFFDRYLNGKDNGWEATPRVRLSLLRYNAPPIRHRPETDYPPRRVQYEKLYLNTENQTLVQQAPGAQSNSITFAANDVQDDGSHFTLTFNKYTELIGFSKAILYVSTDAGDDLDVYVVIRKLDKDGKALINNNIPHKGPRSRHHRSQRPQHQHTQVHRTQRRPARILACCTSRGTWAHRRGAQAHNPR
ncbi:hypothetical protein ONS95_012726 [Cadophora gregata]|uniref:uncharacterized protein n=1 Tax=Cadophora gregata TaxID=51156 RepID=UPI0026DB79FE|nr:uncharacterized protein ONS95_012726 [Cadophora gregata]KAK0118441.1 hypothetical protein ONS95_012726 [Cadophora gregata]KAK0123508.1 hypothetical protein ONS96_010490 [Cadophora gregata f. sp. sojae]